MAAAQEWGFSSFSQNDKDEVFMEVLRSDGGLSCPQMTPHCCRKQLG